MSIDSILILVALTNLMLLANSRLGASIRVTAAQGILLGLLPLVAAPHAGWHAVLIAVGSMALKGVVFPRLMFRALREAEVQREVEPFIGYNLSLLIGVAALAVSIWIGQQLPVPGEAISSLVVPVAMFSILVGLFLIISRKKAVNQVLGFLVLENGVYTFGVGVIQHTSLLVELGVLLDVFVAVFVMGIIIFHISREFDSIDTDALTSLKD
jgi:hydrogenase-4 component E